MSNLRNPLNRHDAFFDEDIPLETRKANLKKVLDDLYEKASFKDGGLENSAPSAESMQEGETKFATVNSTVRRYWKVGKDLYYSDLTKV